MEKRGFTTEIPDAVFGLHDAITEIIRETFEGNVNYGIEVKTMPYEWVREADSHDPTIAGFGPGYTRSSLEKHKASCTWDNCPSKTMSGKPEDGWIDDLQNQA